MSRTCVWPSLRSSEAINGWSITRLRRLKSGLRQTRQYHRAFRPHGTAPALYLTLQDLLDPLCPAAPPSLFPSFTKSCVSRILRLFFLFHSSVSLSRLFLFSSFSRHRFPTSPSLQFTIVNMRYFALAAAVACASSVAAETFTVVVGGNSSLTYNPTSCVAVVLDRYSVSCSI